MIVFTTKYVLSNGIEKGEVRPQPTEPDSKYVYSTGSAVGALVPYLAEAGKEPASGGQTANVAGDSNIASQADRGSSVNITR